MCSGGFKMATKAPIKYQRWDSNKRSASKVFKEVFFKGALINDVSLLGFVDLFFFVTATLPIKGVYEKGGGSQNDVTY